MNRNKFSKRTELDYATIIKWEKGEASPGLDSLERVAKGTGRHVAELVGGRPAEGGEERLERDAAVSPYPDFEAALEAEGLIARVSDGDPDAIFVVKRVRGISYAGGAAEADYAEALHQIARAKAALRGKATVSAAEPEKVTPREGRKKIGPARRR